MIDSDMAKELFPNHNGLGANDVQRWIEMEEEDSTIQNFGQINQEGLGRRGEAAWVDAGGNRATLGKNGRPKGRETSERHRGSVSAGTHIAVGIYTEGYRRTESEGKTGGLIDGYSRYSNDVKRGQPPVLLEEADTGRDIASPKRFYLKQCCRNRTWLHIFDEGWLYGSGNLLCRR